ncbi:tetratricopeptide repeat domain-containing protein [Ditylenchus destructor]|uniref:Tetratricopeptide repeat domain-containing protein n=1 Tax=Ditylenchus destructor TaxID=166010 RepID=A0AAD4QYB4_9BILA|nr:tetratricopeptide repeat domain-containing protein [Ditylenchus destructor]
MPSLKSLFEPECGAPSALVTLSNNYGRANSAGNEIQRSIPGVSGMDLMANEYLSRLCAQVEMPSTFNMNELLRSLPGQADGMERGQLEQIWRQVQNGSNSRQLSHTWTEEFSQQQRPAQFSDQNGNSWANQYLAPTPNLELESAWSAATLQSSSQPVLASEYLERFDSGQMINDQQSSMANGWLEEFLSQHKVSDDTETQMDNVFGTYENAWNDIEQGNFFESYMFNTDNPHEGETEPLEKAETMFRMGNLSDAILYYETALRKNPNDSQTWCKLGLCLAENEQDIQAISAYQKSLDLDPTNKQAVLAVAISLTNEGIDSLAFNNLAKWLALHNGNNTTEPMPEFPVYYDNEWVSKLEGQFLSARQSQVGANADLENAMSIFYNLTKDYEKAVECIKLAISANPQEPVLWNRLGASLANNDRSAEAISAYKTALELFPSYVRARYNLGVSCMNLNSYRDAIGHFLSALQLQKSPENSQIWSKLRSCVIRTGEHSGSTDEIMDALNSRDLPRILTYFQ